MPFWIEKYLASAAAFAACLGLYYWILLPLDAWLARRRSR